ncbi:MULTISPECIES: hypothetical protein [unclassified Haloarcula]|uniref:hypothetical protein n=1 Tax=unclassified Haloarcula TaxID=2624677 RepID=UPI000EF14A0C|nr:MULTISPECIES: hypothetical protein [unclassified Haloarcula]RLM42538.1 hypothetical protein DVK00_15855 [Haloarcula sp. Atlit-47R]RLM95931.1 hypothetical protein D3D01_11230 [Haloarcula sp. Atlit-7R]
MTETDRTRRAVLTAGVAAVTALAGCDSGSGPDSQPSETGTTPPTEPTTTALTPTEGTEHSDLDLREANVTDVAVTNSGGQDYRFDVTLYHDDDGEDGYADWWQVETLAGDRLGRRDLLHAHSTTPFTRSETIAVPGDVACVVVRGHDQTHGYGGQAMTVAVPDGATRAIRQGAERKSVAESDCP